MQQVWFAANATKPNAFLWWWKPNRLDELFAKTDYELQPTFLPPAHRKLRILYNR
jgi:hypothetical protein